MQIVITTRPDEGIVIVSAPLARSAAAIGDAQSIIRGGENWNGLSYDTLVAMGSGEHEFPTS